MKDTILYIDDEQENLEGFQLVFWSRYNLLLAKNTIEAEKLLKENIIKVVITDQKMPDETGISFIDRIKHQYPDLLFIILTGYSEMNIVLEAINTGVYQFVQKPWEEKEMYQIIANAIGKYDLQKQNKELLITLQEKNKELNIANSELLKLSRKLRELKVSGESKISLLKTIFNKTPFIIMLLNAQGQVILLNKDASENLKETTPDLVNLSWGEASTCEYVFNANGCDTSEKCKDCLINNTILNSLKYKTNYSRVEAKLSIKRGEKSEVHDVLISTKYIEGAEPMLLVIIDDISHIDETIAIN